MKKGKGLIRAVLCMLVGLCVFGHPDSVLSASAAGVSSEMLNNPYVKSWQYPNELGEMTTYWTIETPKIAVEGETRLRAQVEVAIAKQGWENANVPIYWYPKDTTVSTGIASSMNAGVDYTGHMEPSFHMYNNETMHNGEPVTPIKHLSPINYQREGYSFVGWNTMPDGSGTSYADRAEIFNLSIYDFEAEEFREGTDKGVITLYAQWKDTRSTLHIDGGGRLL